MGDGITAIARDEERAQAFDKFLNGLIDYLKKPSAEKLESLKGLAHEVDVIPSGYWGKRTKLEKSFTKNLLGKLLAKDKKTWVHLLWGIRGSFDYIYEELLSLSPFDKKTVVFVSYASSSLHSVQIYSPQLRKIIDQAIDENEMVTYDTDSYLVILPVDLTALSEDIEIFWVDSGTLGVNGPRKPEK